MRTSAPDRPETTAPGFRMGVLVFLASLGVLMGAGLVAYAVIRFGAPKWPPADYAPPQGLWVSTLLIAGASIAAQRALNAVRKGDLAALRNGLLLVGALLLAFLLFQVANGVELLRAVGENRKKDLFAFTFFLLVGLHGLHILGGFAPLGVTLVKSFRNRYSREAHDGVWGLTVYVHFLGAVWLAMFLLLLV